jgi:hypothetical protein
MSLSIERHCEAGLEKPPHLSRARELKVIPALAAHGLQQEIAARTQQGEKVAPPRRDEMDDEQRPKPGFCERQGPRIEVAGGELEVLFEESGAPDTRGNEAESILINVRADDLIATFSEEKTMSPKSARGIEDGQSRINETGVLLNEPGGLGRRRPREVSRKCSVPPHWSAMPREPDPALPG